ncbi:MAG TPA: helix-turn-helix transcriptional regulator [Opitutaceae bacterium]|nr:helix-turn-helix transcriptional regulator [Opitutaceae bacterium]
MGYSEQFQRYREARGLTREQLAARADCHRNTVINVESGRPVKFATIIHLMHHLGYGRDSNETRLLALLWLEGVTGIHINGTDTTALASDHAGRFQQLAHDISGRRLTRDDVELLGFAARNRKVLNALRAIRDLVQESARPSPGG